MEYKPQEYWENRANTYLKKEFLRMPRNFFYTIILKNVLTREINNIYPNSVLEVGCGPGRLIDLYENIENIYCVDFSKTMLTRAEEKAKKLGFNKINFANMSCQNLKFTNNYFNLVLTSNVLLHIPPEDINNAISEITRVTNRYILLVEFYNKNIKKEETTSWVFHHDYPKLFKENNLKIIKSYNIPFFSQKCFVLKKI